MAIRAWTDYPIAALGDASQDETPVREVSVLNWDRESYCEVAIGGDIFAVPAKRLYIRPGGLDVAPPLTRRVLWALPNMGEIFVFGSNLAGRHGKGAALAARHDYGAKLGVGKGPTGNAYAIPTKDARLRPLPLDVIRSHVKEFLKYAREHPELTFKVTAIGTGLAGRAHADMAPMFAGAPDNCVLPYPWINILARSAA
jgi:hypothetical protein